MAKAGAVQLGYPVELVLTIGVIETTCLMMYIVPATSIFGAVLPTGDLGGAVATKLRLGNPLFTHIFFPVYIAALLRGGLYLRDIRVRALVPPRDWRGMKFLCLIYLNEKEMDALPAAEMSDLNARHLALNDDLRASGHFIEAEALEPASTTATIRVRGGKATITDGPFAESKEVVAGFYLIEARDIAEAISIAKRFPSAPMATIEVRPTRELTT